MTWPGPSKSGLVSTTSQPTRSRPPSARRIASASRARRAARLGRLHPRRRGGVDEVHVEGQEGRRAACALAHQLRQRRGRQRERLVGGQHPVAELDRLADVGGCEQRAAHPDLERARRLDEALLDRAPERRAGAVPLAAEESGPGVGVGIEVDQRERAMPAGERAQFRQRHAMVAAEAERHGAVLCDRRDRLLDPLERGFHVARHDRRIAEIGHAQSLEQVDPAAIGVDRAQHDRHRADRIRAEARAGAERRARVRRQADHRGIEPGRIRCERQAHEGRHAAKARHVQRVDRRRRRHLSETPSGLFPDLARSPSTALRVDRWPRGETHGSSYIEHATH